MGGVIAREWADCQQDCEADLPLDQSARAAPRPTTATYAGKRESPMGKSGECRGQDMAGQPSPNTPVAGAATGA